ncbi:hypothetical protein AB0C28_44085 [Nonomuraea sp. NPDC048892]|uniref:hypothetical protein n=1 Tax=Nonomuraea sp. NPDC048892 TaxID=3154624 RepID=UPI0033FA9B5C
MMVIHRPGLRRTGVVGLAIATAAIGTVMFSGPAHAASYWVGPFSTKADCERERPKYRSSWSTPGPCTYVINPPGTGTWRFKVTTVG